MKLTGKIRERVFLLCKDKDNFFVHVIRQEGIHLLSGAGIQVCEGLIENQNRGF